MAQIKETSDAKKGGLFVGKSHKEGGIPAIVTDTGQPIEVEGGEAIINKEATAKHWKELSEINQSAGNGVPIPPPSSVQDVEEKFSKGGKLTNSEKKDIYDKWKYLVNMTGSELRRYYHTKDGKESGLTKAEAEEHGISSGRESAEWIMKMKKVNWKKWTPEMWIWATKQISFISRMSGIKGDLYDDKKNKTRKHKALLIWGHNPKKAKPVELKHGGELAPKGDTNKNRKWKIRFHLGAGKDFMKWKVENADLKSVQFYEPEKVQIRMTNCKLTNSPATAQKIFTGEINKSPIAWVNCEKAEVDETIDAVDLEERISYNPRKAPNWMDADGNIIDNFVFDHLITFGRSVYYDDGTDVYEVGGWVDEFAEGGYTPEEDKFDKGGIAGLKAMLLFLSGEEKAELEAEISRLEAEDKPAKAKSKPKSNEAKPDQAKVDDMIKDIQKKYLHETEVILGITSSEEQRKSLLKWILDPEQNVKVIIAFSGGKDSIAMVLRAIYEYKIPKSQIELWHHEVDGMGENFWDWKCTPSYCRAFADAMGVPLLFSYADGGILKEMYKENSFLQPVFFQQEDRGEYTKIDPRGWEKDRNTRRKFPQVVTKIETRWCSGTAKIDVMAKAINNSPRLKNANILIMTGERRAESPNRATYDEIEKYRSYTNTRKALTWRSVIDMTEQDVWDLFEKHKIQPHPCYELGWGRCSCQICIFNQANTWASCNQLDPKKIERLASIEKELGSTLFTKKEKGVVIPSNIYEAMVNKGQSEIDPVALERWGAEALGEFVSPIIVKEWKLPKGAFSKEQSGAN